MTAPLSEKLRPKTFDEIIGHETLLGKEGWIKRIIQSQKPLSLLFFGPPGSGKTTLARLYGSSFQCPFIQFSAVSTTLNDIKAILKDAKDHPLFQRQTILFLDELHRFNKLQQDIFLPYIENGTLVLVGATTENPSFVINNALLSRLRVIPLHPLTIGDLNKIIERCEAKLQIGPLPKESRELLLELSKGDARHLINLIENIVEAKLTSFDLPSISQVVQGKLALYDRDGEGHYNLISALHKSVRGSDPQASLYWLCRMLEGGEDPLYLARRLIRMAVEDVGLADPQALQVCLNARDTWHMLGSPEGDLALAEAVVYLALAPKSNAIYTAFAEAKEAAKKTHHLSPPKKILNAPTPLMKEMGYGKEYIYDHDTEDGFSGQNYFPDEMQREEFFHPVERGFERELKKRIAYFQRIKESLGNKVF